MTARGAGWSVLLHLQTDTLMLMQGNPEPWGYVIVAWTAGSKREGRTLLADTIARRKEAK